MADDPHWYTPFWRALHLSAIALGHTMVAGVLLWGGEVLSRLVGNELLFDAVPKRYIVDVMELAIVGSYVIFGTISFVQAIKREDKE